MESDIYSSGFTTGAIALLFSLLNGAAFYTLIHQLIKMPCSGVFQDQPCEMFMIPVLSLHIALPLPFILWAVLDWHYEYEWTDAYWNSVTEYASLMGISALVSATLSLLSAIVWMIFGLDADLPAKGTAI